MGGVNPGEGNRIAYNGEVGVAITADAGPSHSILGNSIHDNGTVGNDDLGIDLNNDDVTDNDLGNPPDQDGGANGLLNFPIIDSAGVLSGGTRVVGTLLSTPNIDFRIEFFANSECDFSSHGEGKIFLGAEEVRTDANGSAPVRRHAPDRSERRRFAHVHRHGD